MLSIATKMQSAYLMANTTQIYSFDFVRFGIFFFFTFEIKIGKSGFHTISGRISLDDRYEKVKGIIIILIQTNKRVFLTYAVC